MKKLVILFELILGINIFAFSISDIDFDKKVKLNSETNRKYQLKNDNNKPMRYKLSIEDDSSVSVNPQTLVLKPYELKEFTIEAVGKQLGSHKYLLVIKESPLTKENGLNINMNYEIEQKYEVIK